MAQRPISSFIEKKINNICGQWLDGFKRDNLEVSLLQAKITLSNVYLKTDQLCLLLPTFAPKLAYVGKLSLDIPLGLSASRPLKVTVSDVMIVIRIGSENVSTQEAREAMSARVHVRRLINALASHASSHAQDPSTKKSDTRKGGGAAAVSIGNVVAFQKVVQKLEVSIKNAHIRVEENVRDDALPNGDGGSKAQYASPEKSRRSANVRKPVTLGLCVRQISLGPDVRDSSVAEKNNQEGQEAKMLGRLRWVGRNYKEMEKEILHEDARFPRIPVNHVWNGRPAHETHGTEQSRGSAAKRATWGLGKFVSIRGLTAYFCHDEECYTHGNREETVRRMRERSRAPPNSLPPLLRRWRGGVGIKVVLSAEELGKIKSIDLSVVAGDVNIQVTGDHLEYLLRWASLLSDHTGMLGVVATRPILDSTGPSLLTAGDSPSPKHKSRFYHALWKQAIELVLRSVRASIKRRGEAVVKQRRNSGTSGRPEDVARNYGTDDNADSKARSNLWRLWFNEWVWAARYVSAREFMHPYLMVNTLSDDRGGVYENFYEDLALHRKTHRAYSTYEFLGHYNGDRRRSSSSMGARGGSGARGGRANVLTGEKLRVAKLRMPWEIPGEDTKKAWELIRRKCVRWERRHAGKMRLALEEERADYSRLDPRTLQALWSIQLQMDVLLRHRLCAAARQMAVARVSYRSKTDALWHLRAEKQRRLGLDNTIPSHSLPPPISRAGSGTDDAVDRNRSDMASSQELQDLGDGRGAGEGLDTRGDLDVMSGLLDGGNEADRVGTLLVRMGQLEDLGSMGSFAFVPNAVATLLVEESSASLEQMEMETVYTKVSRFDAKNDRCLWNETFRFQVELDEVHVLELRREKCRRSRNSTSPVRRSASSLPGTKAVSDRQDAADAAGRGSLPDEVGISLDMSHVNSFVSVTSDERCPSPIASECVGSLDDSFERGFSQRSSSLDSTSSKVLDPRPSSSFLLSISCVDKGIFGQNQLGSLTLPSNKLLSVPLKVMEHRCTLFSATCADRDPPNLMFHTVYVPPGEDVSLAERELGSVGTPPRSREVVEGDLPSTTPRLGRSKSGSGRRRESASPSPSGGSHKSRRGDVDPGTHRVQILTSSVDGKGTTGYDGSSTAMETRSAQEGEGDSRHSPPRPSKTVRVTALQFPDEISLVVRLSGLKTLVYQRYERTNRGDGQLAHESFVSVGKIWTSRLEAILEMSTPRRQVAASVQAGVVELVDNSLLGSNPGLETSGKTRQSCNPWAQVVRVGPLGIEVHGEYNFKEDDGVVTAGPDSYQSTVLEPGQVGNADVLPTLGAKALSSDSHSCLSDAIGNASQLESSPRCRWDWAGSLRIGARTVELADWRGRDVPEEVRRWLRFVFPGGPYLLDGERAQVLRGSMPSKTEGVVGGSCWLVRKGERRLTINLQMPRQGAHDIVHPESPTSQVYVSSSDSDSESPSPTRGLDSARVGTPSRPKRCPQTVFPTMPSVVQESDDAKATNVRRWRWAASSIVANLREKMVESGGKEETATVQVEEGVSVDSCQTISRESYDALARRVRELEAELNALRTATAQVAQAAVGAVALASRGT